jgi:ADP-ribose pyrophosphatase
MAVAVRDSLPAIIRGNCHAALASARGTGRTAYTKDVSRTYNARTMTWTRQNRTLALDTRWLRVFRDTYALPTGQTVDDYYVVERDNFVLVVAQLNGGVALVRQYRPATQRYYYSLPAGYIAVSETPESAARRELLEETGLTATSFTTIGELHSLPGYIKSFAYVVSCDGVAGTLAVSDADEIESVAVHSWRRKYYKWYELARSTRCKLFRRCYLLAWSTVSDT